MQNGEKPGEVPEFGEVKTFLERGLTRAALFAIIALAVEKQLMPMGNGVTAAPATLTRIV